MRPEGTGATKVGSAAAAALDATGALAAGSVTTSVTPSAATRECEKDLRARCLGPFGLSKESSRASAGDEARSGAGAGAAGLVAPGMGGGACPGVRIFRWLNEEARAETLATAMSSAAAVGAARGLSLPSREGRRAGRGAVWA